MSLRRNNPPTAVIWIVCLILYLVALLAHFRVFRVSSDFATWAWILGYGLLLVANRVRRL
jgi:hypothetical protein